MDTEELNMETSEEEKTEDVIDEVNKTDVEAYETQSCPTEEDTAPKSMDVSAFKEEESHKAPWDSYYAEPVLRASESGKTGESKKEEKPKYSPIPEDPVRKPSSAGKKVLAAVLVLVLIATSCWGTAAVLNRRWEEKTQQMSADLQSQVADLQTQIAAIKNKPVAQSGISTAGTVVTMDGLSPAQVYAMNVNSVVAISANSTRTNIYGQETETASSSSGFFLTEDGYVVTNHHVIEGANKLKVITFDEQEYDATLVGSNETNDIALLKVEGEGFPAVKIGSSSDLIVGDMVVAIGNPLGQLTSTQTVGYVSAKDRTINIDGTLIDMIQTDAAINAGNSGGPLFNMKGEVVGITSAKYSGSTSSGASIEGIGFAIPMDDVYGMFSDLMNYGYITGAYLGVSVRSMDSQTTSLYNLPMGCYVESVVEGGCAEKAGVQSKDIIIGLGEYDVKGYTDLARALRKFKAGDTTTIRVYRGGEEVTMEITFDERPHEDISQMTAPAADEDGIPENGSYRDWFEFLKPFFGEGSDDNE